MNTKDRFKRMREVERGVAKLVEKGWRVQRVQYDDEANEPLHATITLTIDSQCDEDRGVL